MSATDGDIGVLAHVLSGVVAALPQQPDYRSASATWTTPDGDIATLTLTLGAPQEDQ